jgi:hypothetical protein
MEHNKPTKFEQRTNRLALCLREGRLYLKEGWMYLALLLLSLAVWKHGVAVLLAARLLWHMRK